MQTDDDLAHFAAQGAPPLPPCSRQGAVEHDGARIWYAAYGADPTVILLHGGLGHSGNWGYQLPTLPGVSHFAPLQRPALFNRALLDFLADVLPPPER